MRLRCALLIAAACGPKLAPTDASSRGMSDEEAQQIVADAEAELAQAVVPDPPTDLEAVLRVLQSDRIDLFPAGIAVAERIGGLEGDALAAQLELSWSEAQMLVAGVLYRAADAVDEELRSTSTRRGIGARRERLEDRRARAREVVTRSRRLADALKVVSAIHLARGGRRAEAVLDADAEHYLSARLAADYFRIRERWADFETSLAELEVRRPDSTGLKFLRGAALVQRGGDRDEALRWLRAAIDEDENFTRARVFALVAQRTLPGIRRELNELERMSPRHQLVVWAKPLIEQGYLPFSES